MRLTGELELDRRREANLGEAWHSHSSVRLSNPNLRAMEIPVIYECITNQQ
jgi:hypothetical protein